MSGCRYVVGVVYVGDGLWVLVCRARMMMLWDAACVCGCMCVHARLRVCIGEYVSEEARVGVRSPGVVACVCCWRVPERRTAMSDMSGNGIGAEGVAALAPVLGRLAQLTNLNLSREWVSVWCMSGTGCAY